MSFNQSKLTRSVSQSQGIFNKYIYQTEDTIATVLADGYFAQSRYREDDGWVGSYLEAQCSDGYLYSQISLNGSSAIIDVSDGPPPAPPVLTTGTREELIAALSSLDIVNGSAGPFNRQNIGVPPILAISNGGLTLTGRLGWYRVAPQGGVSGDELDTINDSGVQVGDVIMLNPASDVLDVVITGNGNIRADPVTLADIRHNITLFYDGFNWIQKSVYLF
jgi:hypothetical protein